MSQKSERTVNAVEMIYFDQPIGRGEAVFEDGQFTIDTTYNWPPGSIAEVKGNFRFKPLSDTVGSVAAEYPGLLQKPIDDPAAGYFTVLIGARPLYNITTPTAQLGFSSTGPFSIPERVTGYQLQIQAEGQHGLHFYFRFTD